MRKIKYRIWDKRIRRKVKWVDWGIFIGVDGRVYEKHYAEVVEVPPDKVEITFFTGLKDKNNKEVFEGDILEVREHVNPSFVEPIRKNIVIMKWVGRKLCFNFDPNSISVCDFRIVGNIYENPKLLREVKGDD